MTDDTEIRFVKLEARLDELAREIGRVEEWARQEFLSTMENQRQTGEQMVKLDTIMRGANGGNGLSGRLSGLEAKGDVHRAHFDGRLDGVEHEMRRAVRWGLGLLSSILIVALGAFVRSIL